MRHGHAACPRHVHAVDGMRAGHAYRHRAAEVRQSAVGTSADERLLTVPFFEEPDAGHPDDLMQLLHLGEGQHRRRCELAIGAGRDDLVDVERRQRSGSAPVFLSRLTSCSGSPQASLSMRTS